MEATGIIFTVLDEISYKLNFTYNVREPDDGSYAGMIQKVQSLYSICGFYYRST